MPSALGPTRPEYLVILGIICFVLFIVRFELRRRRRRLKVRRTVATYVDDWKTELADITLLRKQGNLLEVERRCLATLAVGEENGAPYVILSAALPLAWSRAMRGRLAEAETDLAAVIAEHGPTLNPEFNLAWLAASELGHIQVRRGRYADGIAMARWVAEECERRWGVESETALSARARLGICLVEAKQPADAVSVLTAVLAAELSANSRAGWAKNNIMEARHNLAEARLELGELDEAEPELRAVMTDYDRFHRGGPIAVAGVRFSLAKIAALRGRHEEAIDGFSTVLAEARAIFGEDGPWTLETRFELAKLAARTGHTAAALSQHQAVLADRIRVLGPDHPDTTASREAVVQCGLVTE